MEGEVGDLPSTVGKLARNASNAGGVAFKNSLGALGVPPATGATALGPVNVLETAGTPGPDGPTKTNTSSQMMSHLLAQ